MKASILRPSLRIWVCFRFLSYSESLKFDTNFKLEVIQLVRLHEMPKTQGLPEVPSQKERQKEKTRLSRQLICGRKTRRRGPPTPVSIMSYFILVGPGRFKSNWL